MAKALKEKRKKISINCAASINNFFRFLEEIFAKSTLSGL